MKSIGAKHQQKRGWSAGVMLACAVLSSSAWACGDKMADDPWVSPWKMEYISVLTSPLIDDYAT